MRHGRNTGDAKGNQTPTRLSLFINSIILFAFISPTVREAVRGQRLVEQGPCQQVHLQGLVFCGGFRRFCRRDRKIRSLPIGLSESSHVHLTESTLP